MATKKYMSYDNLVEYDSNIKAYVDGSIEAIPSDVFIINITESNGSYILDRDIVECANNFLSGKLVMAFYNGRMYEATDAEQDYSITFTNISMNKQQGSDYDSLSVMIRTFACLDGDGIFYTESSVSPEQHAYKKLTTTSNTIVGAINELDAEMDSHTHDDLYYTETEVDNLIVGVNTSISNITSGTTVVKEAEHADSADEATHATSADSATSATSATKATQDGNGKVISSTYETKTDATAKLTEAKAYADTAATNAAATVKNDLLNGAGTAYDTLKELGDLIDDNKDAIDALEDIASGKADATHTHAIADVSGLQSALDGKAAASHGTHVTFDSTNKPKMDGTAAFGTSTSVARADHVHPTDTSRASQSDLDALETVVSGKANASHTHAISDVTNLQSSLDAKATTSALTTHTNNADIHFTAAERTKLSGIATGANKTTVDSALSTTSTNPVRNSVVTTAINSATSAISANTSSIENHTTAITNLQTAVAEFEEITSAEIQALFA